MCIDINIATKNRKLNPSNMGDVYFTPQHKTNAVPKTREIQTTTIQASSEYVYEDDKVSNLIPSENYLNHDDEYVLSPQDRDDTPEYRPRKEHKGHEKDIYDEDHYALARNSGFGKDFSTSVVRKSTVFNSQPKEKMLWRTRIIIISVILVLFVVDGLLSYVLIERIKGNGNAQVTSKPSVEGSCTTSTIYPTLATHQPSVAFHLVDVTTSMMEGKTLSLERNMKKDHQSETRIIYGHCWLPPADLFEYRIQSLPRG